MGGLILNQDDSNFGYGFSLGFGPENISREEAIKYIPERYPHIELLQYVVMPNHIHMILRVRAKTVAPSMSQVVKQFKGVVSKQAGMGIWQKSFYDHVIRVGGIMRSI